MEVAKFGSIPWDTFRVLPYAERVKLLAFYRVQNKLDWVRSVYPDLKGG